ncbi:MAG: sugar O-acetyltransferase [Muribaculaceae bacterium]
MAEWNKMRSGEMYDWTDPIIDHSLTRSRLACEEFNKSGIDHDNYRQVLEDMIPDIPASATILPPFHCDHGNGLHIGENVFVNYNAMMLDAGDITIGARTLIGPNCALYTPQHPLDYRQRRQTIESAHPIVIGEDCWLGGNVTICPGVTIGDRTVIGAGSVVTHDIPADTLAAGNPCRVIRSLK